MHITGGDISASARQIYEKMINDLKPYLSKVAIDITLSTLNWDGTNPNSTSHLCDDWLNKNSCGCNEYVTVVANFSGEAQRNLASFKRSFEHIHERIHGKNCTMVWVEPIMSGANTFLERILSWFTPGRNSAESLFRYRYYWHHPIQNRRLTCDVLVMKYNRI
jgi:hypothetical protein